MGDLLDLAREVVALTRWRVPGGQLRDERGVMWIPSDKADWLAGGAGSPVPDLADPATLGCLLALVREAWGQDDLAAVQIGTDGKGGQEWAVRSHLHAPRQHLGWGEAHALVAALRAAGGA